MSDLRPCDSVCGFESLDDAIEVANSLPFAFQASVFSRDIGPALRAAKRLVASAVMINDRIPRRLDALHRMPPVRIHAPRFYAS
jgi:acyl-CoA reductase-like NAD-dependent aldehyde dehydrogenase